MKVLKTKTEQHKCMATKDIYILWQEKERIWKISQGRSSRRNLKENNTQNLRGPGRKCNENKKKQISKSQ